VDPGGAPPVYAAVYQFVVVAMISAERRCGCRAELLNGAKAQISFLPLIGIPNIENAEEDYLRAMRIFGKKWKLGSLADGGPHVELLRCGFYKLSILCQHLLA